MKDNVLTRERILEAAEDVLRRYGPSKTTVVDVARALDVSHGTVYRHFASKADLRDAVAELWLARVMPPLAEVVQETGPAEDRLHRWLLLLIQGKHSRALEDPELFATYITLASEAREVVHAHVEDLISQITQIIQEGVAQGEFAGTNPATAGRAVFHATSRFHNPAHRSEWSSPDTMKDFDGVWELLITGLRIR